MLQAPNLKRMAMQFVVRNMGSVVRSRDWKECLLDHPGLMAEVGLIEHFRNNAVTFQVMEAMARKDSGEGFGKRSTGNYSGKRGQTNFSVNLIF